MINKILVGKHSKIPKPRRERIIASLNHAEIGIGGRVPGHPEVIVYPHLILSANDCGEAKYRDRVPLLTPSHRHSWGRAVHRPDIEPDRERYALLLPDGSNPKFESGVVAGGGCQMCLGAHGRPSLSVRYAPKGRNHIVQTFEINIKNQNMIWEPGQKRGY